jgi:3-deoxy-D-manno-octulosonic-acid transferase
VLRVPAALEVGAPGVVVAGGARPGAIGGRRGGGGGLRRGQQERGRGGDHGLILAKAILAARVYLLYSALLAVAFAVSAPFYLWKGRGTGRYLGTLGERMGGGASRLPAPDGPAIWIHAVSVGEALAARALVAPLKARLPGHRVFLSTTTVTGQAIAREVAAADGVFYAPFDFRRSVRRTLDRLRPVLLVLVETEIWPNLIHEAKLRGTRVAMVNGRISPRSFPRYRRVRGLLGRVLGEVDLFLMQGEAHRSRLVAMGGPAQRARVSGNLKYDSLAAPDPSPALKRALGVDGATAPLLVAGSTMEGEEEAVLAAFAAVGRGHPEARLVLAPRRPERFAAAAEIAAASGLRVARRTTLAADGWRDGDVLVLDTVGELAQVYALATVVFVGGSLAPRGGHNVLEPAVAGKPIVVGPHMENFQEIAAAFLAEGAMVQVRDAAGLAAAVTSLFDDAPRREELGRRARAVVERNRGALERTVSALAALVS